MLDLVAWQVETRYCKSQGAMEMAAFGRISVINKLLKPMPNRACLFAAPEFLLRDTKTFFQTVAGKDAVLVSLKKLSAAFPQILIMPGTIPWLEPVPAAACGQLYKAYLRETLRVASDSARKYHQDLRVHIQRELERLAQATHVYLARNTLFCLKNGQVVHTYHKRFEAIGQELPAEAVLKFDRAIFFPPQANSPYFVEEDSGLLFGVKSVQTTNTTPWVKPLATAMWTFMFYFPMKFIQPKSTHLRTTWCTPVGSPPVFTPRLPCLASTTRI